jgi:RNA recognition motif-containing protein
MVGQVVPSKFPEPLFLQMMKLFVRNFTFNLDNQQLGELFEGAQEFLDDNILTKKETGNSCGFGFVTMATFEEVDKGVEILIKYSLDDRLLIINKASP